LTMPIIETVEQLADFLEQNEEWRRKIYSILVPRELARLPAEFDEFRAETRREFDSVRAEMREGFEQLRAEIRAGDGQIRAEMRENSERVEQKIQKNTDAIAELKGISLEQYYRNRARALFGRYFRDVRGIDWIDLEEPLEAVALLTEREREELSVVDLLARGRRKTDGQEVVLVIEVSWVIVPNDVERAVQRAKILSQRGVMATPVVAGREINDKAREAARTASCALVMDGRFEFDPPLQGA